jgi:NDP-sugar pyrophosphorylase family protein
MGLLRFTPAGWATVEAYLAGLAAGEQDAMDMTSLLRGLLEQGVPVRAVPCVGGWVEVDQPSDLLLYERLLADRQLELELEVEA